MDSSNGAVSNMDAQDSLDSTQHLPSATVNNKPKVVKRIRLGFLLFY